MYNRAVAEAALLGTTWDPGGQPADHEAAMRPCDNGGKQHPGQQKGNHF